MLWDLIRDFFVQHVFGGADSLGNYYYCTIGTNPTNGTFDSGNTYTSLELLMDDGTIGHITYGDYFSTIATMISITIIVVLCCLFVYKIIKLIGGLIR